MPTRAAHGTDAGTLVHGRYRLRARLGAGGFGVVWRAHDELLNREVALKRIPLPERPHHEGHARGGSRPDELPRGERAGREALAAARLAHPAIVALYEAYVDDDAFFLVSELVDGQTLAQLIAAGELTDRETLLIGIALADALVHAHARGVVHRDVKPQNVLVPSPRGEADPPAKLTDFGGAQLAGDDALTRTGETLGTLAYMAPEQVEGADVDERADTYSLALVLYEALAGSNPLRGPTPAATARRVGRPVPPLSSSRPDLARGLCGGLDRALAVDPRQRGTLPELRATLEQAAPAPARGTRLLRRRRDRRAGPQQPADSLPSSDSATPIGGSLQRTSTPTAIAPSARSGQVARAGPRAQPDPAPPPDGVTAVAPPAVRRPTQAPAEHERASFADGESQAPVTPEPRRALGDRFPLPRAVWLGLAIAAAVWQATQGRSGLGLLILAFAAPLLLLGRRPGVGWLVAALAPILGLLGLAGAYPALAGQASRYTRRAALGALGYWWLVLSEPLARAHGDQRLWLGPPPGIPAHAVWEGSLQSAAAHVIGPTLTLGVLLGACLWAAGAAVLPWLVRGRSVALDALATAAWSALLFAAAPPLDTGLTPSALAPSPRGAVLGAIAAGAIAIAARALRGPV